MRKQQQVWQKEHQNVTNLPAMAQDQPSTSVVAFIDYLRGKVSPPAKVVDIGCGKGRNAIFLAKLGFEVYGMDYIQQALDHTKQKAIQNNLLDKIYLYNTSIDEKWPFKDNFFDLSIDCFSSIDIETKGGREIYRQEMFRTLKPAGYAMVAVVSIDDEIEKELLKTSPGLEKNSTIWPDGKFQKDYDEEELREFYKDFEIPELKEIKKKVFKLNTHYTATNYWVVLRKL